MCEWQGELLVTFYKDYFQTNMKKKLFLLAMVAMTAIFVSSCKNGNKEANNDNPCELTGAGATFPEPFYTSEP